MRIAWIAMVALVCAALASCVTQRMTLPPETRAELIRLGRIIIDHNESEEIRCDARMRYCDLVREAIDKHGKKSVDRQTIIDSFVVDGRKPKDMWIDSGMLDYMFELQNGTYATLTIYFGGWTGSYVWDAIPNGAIP